MLLSSVVDQLTLSDIQECCGRADVSCVLKEVVSHEKLDRLLSTVYASIETSIPHDKLIDAQTLAYNWMLSAFRE